MAELVVGKIMDPIIDKLIKTAFEYFQDQPSMKAMLERLRDNRHKVQAVVSFARRAQIIEQDPDLNKWIWQLRDAIDEADDLLDDFDYQKHEQQLAINKEEEKKRRFISDIVSNTAKTFRVSYDRFFKINPNLKRLEEAVQKLDRVSAKVSAFLHLLENIKQEQRGQLVELHKTRETGSLPNDDLIGRGKDKQFIIEWLRQPSDVSITASHRNISILSIVGHGGMGKTTLLQHVYADEITKEFDLKMWVCVSHNFDVKKVITDMLECLQKKRPSLETLDTLQESLQSEVESNKFLLVLDDIWDDEEGTILDKKWGNVLAPLANGGWGSKILITTRTDSVASMIAKVIRKKNEAFRLEGLEEDECLQLLTTHAFADAENPDDHKKLKVIAGELVKKLYGSPLAAKVMGGVLNSSLDESHWRYLLNKSLDHNDIFSILKLSYIFLPEHLQSCFSYCSIFKQDHLFYKEDLIQMWIAVGFIQSSNDNQGEALTVEDIGERYFGVLIKKSFLEVVKKIGDTKLYKMHDLLHDLAEFVSKQECFRFVGNEKSLLLEIPETIRYLTIETRNPEVLKTVGRFKNLRMLGILYEYDSNLVDALIEIFQVTRSIRSLILLSKLEVIPEEIKYLQHLRYLRFLGSNVKLLPRSLSSLYHLQFIKLNNDFCHDCPNDYFPRDMNKLSNLRWFECIWFNFSGIGKLKLLQKLDPFNIKNENGYKIEELEHMNELRILYIDNLKDLRDAQEASNAKLCDKKKLSDLYLNWVEKCTSKEERDIEDRELDERVLDNLQPHNYLKKMKIYNYMGARSAIWMNGAHTINNLEHINLYDCLEWEILPPFGQLPFLKTLYLSRMLKVKRLENKFHGNDMRCVFPSLEKLKFQNMKALVDWFDASVVDDLFPCLTKLELYNCPNLQELPYLPPKLKKLKIYNIGWKTLNCCSISKSVPLKTLDVFHCPNITSISLVGEIDKLKKLILEDLQSLQSLSSSSSSLTNIISLLEFVEMKMLPQLQEYPDLPLPLKKMKIKKPKLRPKILKKFIIKNESGYRIEELEQMNHVVGLVLVNLKDVRDAEEAYNAKLCDKRELMYLTLHWDDEYSFLTKGDNADHDLYERVLDNLQPHNYLKTLRIHNYMGARSAIWMNEAHLINNLEEIKLSHCLEWEILPPFGQLPFLKTLWLCNMPKVKQLENKFHGNDMCSVFPSLQNLFIGEMEALVGWFDASVVDDFFPCLTELHLRNCPNLQELPYLPPKLKKLKIKNIGWKTLNFYSISTSIPLETLEVRNCPNITSIFVEGEMGKLRNLILENLQSLQYVSSSLTNIISLLKVLKLAELPQLQKYLDPSPSA